MIYRRFLEDVLFLQRFLKVSGFDPGPLDGSPGTRTLAAAQAFDEETRQIAAQMGTFADQRTELLVQTLQPRAQLAARRFVQKLHAAHLDVRILSGTRTYAEQNALYRKGRSRTAPGPIVTNARGGHSNHNFGIAWDIGLFRQGVYLTDAAPYDEAAALGLEEGLEWGGHWKSLRDRPHYQLALQQRSLAIVRAAFEQGTLVV